MQAANWHAGTLKKGSSAPPRDAIEAHDTLASALDPSDMYDWISEMLDAPLFGTIPVEIIYARRAGRISVERLSPKPAEYIRYTESG